MQLESSYPFPNGMRTNNRLVLAPLTISASLAGGIVSDEDAAFYRRRAGSAGLLITGSAYVHPLGQAYADSFSVADDDKIPGLAKLAEAMKSQGNLAILQIYHGGRMVPATLIESQPVAPSAVAAEHGEVTVPKSLSNTQIEELLQDFLAAIRRAMVAGFDGVELHGANTYLIQQFLSPHSNRRQDKWGGTLNNRMRFAKTLVKRARQLIDQESPNSFLLGYRFSPEEIEVPGIELKDSLALIDQLIRLGIDYLHVSMDHLWQSSLRKTEENTPVILAIRDKINGRVPLIGVGKVRNAEDYKEALKSGIPLLSMGTSLLLEPDWLELYRSKAESEIRTYLDEENLADLALPQNFVRDYGSYYSKP
ncbi:MULTISPECIES: NADH-dependent flavin oxidoreductase [unclassified Streptococcus]|uniref:NADH-dependent flavin oxidoreductase n=1 Tax=unclassified Streptococcus TaxID=2608887 RepID=UPI001072AD18|nr:MULTISPECIES: NADH-dependent flavin oxidoreductase [unclassified Streptococcus]MBF0805217.1 NADH-dependent flavin oxidoreductase [Streptococcus sp. 19428wA2_WM07]TFU29255.1 NADH-dependent flavin oxidoreductase [Streptococcus sp. WM07]